MIFKIKQFSLNKCISKFRLQTPRKPSLVQIMACRLIDTKPLSELMLTYCQMNTQEQI